MSLIKKIVRVLANKSPSSSDDVPTKPTKNDGSDSRPSNRKNHESKSEDERPKQRRRRNHGSKNTNRKDRDSNRSQTRSDTSQHESRKNTKQKNTGRKSKQEDRRPPPETKSSPIKSQTFVEPVGFKDLGLREEILRAIGEEGYENPTPIQQASIAELAKGRDLLGCAQTGTGKTAAFALPTLHRLSQESPRNRPIRILILTPTRELALQVSESYANYGRHLNLKTTVIFGGVGADPQKRALKRGIDVLVATPGRLLDLHNQGFVHFGKLEILVLDEADRMLDMGFLPDVKRILKLLPKVRQNILFSATMPRDIQDLSMRLLKDPIKVEVAPVSSTSEQIEQAIYFVSQLNKRKLLLHILSDPSTNKVLVFTRTKAIANRIAKFLVEKAINTEAIHGNKSQSARQRALENFKDGKTRVLVASDLAARGLDVEDITHVINYDLPNIAETYVHRIGRTGRAEAEGKAISFCAGEERAYLKSIERLIGKHVPIIDDHPFPFSASDPDPPQKHRNRPREGHRHGGFGPKSSGSRSAKSNHSRKSGRRGQR